MSDAVISRLKKYEIKAGKKTPKNIVEFIWSPAFVSTKAGPVKKNFGFGIFERYPSEKALTEGVTCDCPLQPLYLTALTSPCQLFPE